MKQITEIIKKKNNYLRYQMQGADVPYEMYAHRIKTKTKLAALLYPGVAKETAKNNLSALIHRGKSIKIDHLEIICKYLECTPNDIFNFGVEVKSDS